MNDAKEKLLDSIVAGVTDTAASDGDGATRPAADPATLDELGADSLSTLESEIELAAAAAALAFARDAARPMPEALRERLLAAAPVSATPAVSNVTPIGAAAKPQPAPPQRPGNLFASAGWAAAAMLLIALVVGNLREDALVLTDPAAERLALLERPATIVTEWQPPDSAEFAGVTGDVVWNDAEQRGYMRLSGMPANDPSVAQYQLWIVDPDRDANPVDGGVFDIPATGGEVIVPINAKLAVDEPAAFAITREQPGGVVVSAGPLLVVAATG